MGAGLLAKVVNDDVGVLIQRGALMFFASKPAPTLSSSAFDLEMACSPLDVSTMSPHRCPVQDML